MLNSLKIHRQYFSLKQKMLPTPHNSNNILLPVNIFSPKTPEIPEFDYYIEQNKVIPPFDYFSLEEGKIKHHDACIRQQFSKIISILVPLGNTDKVKDGEVSGLVVKINKKFFLFEK